MTLSAAWQMLKRNQVVVLLILIIAIGTFLRLFQLGTESIWLDEASSLYESTLRFAEMSSHSNQPPLYFILLHWWTIFLEPVKLLSGLYR